MSFVDDVLFKLAADGFSAEQVRHLIFDDLGGLSEEQTGTARCAHCLVVFACIPNGRKPKYCSRTCRQTAYTARRDKRAVIA